MRKPIFFCVACLFAGLANLFIFADNSARAAEAENRKPVAGQQVEQVFKSSQSVDVPYLIYLPDNYDASTDAIPLVLFLHGRGESNGPLSLVAKWGPPRMAGAGDSLPFLLVSPQCPRQDFWSSETQQGLLVELLDHITETYRVDKDRIHLTGLSMGGYGSWRLAADHPDRFASVVPICGSGKPEDANILARLPIWVFHGTEDAAVPIEKSTEMVDAIRAAGGKKIRYTILEHVGHNSWSAAYATPELYGWMLSQKRATAE